MSDAPAPRCPDCKITTMWEPVDGEPTTQIVGDLQTGEVHEEPLPPPVTPEEFINGN